MADERLTDQAAFAGTEIQDTDLFWIEVDNGDTTFSDYKITGLQMKALMPSIYTADDTTGIGTRTVTVGNSLVFEAGDQTINLNTGFIQWQRLDGVTPANTRSISINSSFLNIDSRVIRYQKHDEHTHTVTTLSNVTTTLNTYTPADSSHFMVKAWVKAHCNADGTAYYKEYTGLYKTVSGTTTLVGTPSIYEEDSDMAVTAVFDIVGNTVRLRVTGLSMKTIDWTAVVNVM